MTDNTSQTNQNNQNSNLINDNNAPNSNNAPNQSNGQAPANTVSIESLIDVNVANQLIEMGFSKNVSQKACLFSSSNIEKAIEWIEQHREDPDFEEPAQVSTSGSDQPKKSNLSAEEAKIKAMELQEQIRKRQKEKDEQNELEHERLRIQSIKEAQMAKEAEEERQMKIYLEKKKKDEEEDKAYRKKILEDMEKERCEKLGIKYVPKEEQEKAKVYTPFENISYFIQTMRTVYNPFRCGDTLKKCLSTIKVFVSNVLKNPNEDKFKKIKLNNPNVYERVGKITTAVKLLEELGFNKQEDIMTLGQQWDKGLFEQTLQLLEQELSKLN